jgi:hypothetical protein
MEIVGECVRNFLVNVLLGKRKLFKDINMKTPFHAFSLGNGLNNFLFGNVMSLNVEIIILL